MEIKEGQKYYCKETVVMDGSNTVAYKKGNIYPCQMDGCITDEQGEIEHIWEDAYDEFEDMEMFNRHFELMIEFPANDIFSEVFGINGARSIMDDVLNIGKFESHCDLKLNKEMSQHYLNNSNEFRTIVNSIASLLEYKDEKYGNAVSNPLEIFAGKCKAGTRLDDKLSRVKNGETLRKNDIADIIGYLVHVCVENGWNNFDEYKD